VIIFPIFSLPEVEIVPVDNGGDNEALWVRLQPKVTSKENVIFPQKKDDF
jgi:hypothetical protein